MKKVDKPDNKAPNLNLARGFCAQPEENISEDDLVYHIRERLGFEAQIEKSEGRLLRREKQKKLWNNKEAFYEQKKP